MKKFKNNPIPEILKDSEWEELDRRNLLSHIEIRDYQIRKFYESIKKTFDKKRDAVEYVSGFYPGLNPETIRKIIYSK